MAWLASIVLPPIACMPFLHLLPLPLPTPSPFPPGLPATLIHIVPQNPPFTFMPLSAHVVHNMVSAKEKNSVWLSHLVCGGLVPSFVYVSSLSPNISNMPSPCRTAWLPGMPATYIHACNPLFYTCPTQPATHIAPTQPHLSSSCLPAASICCCVRGVEERHKVLRTRGQGHLGKFCRQKKGFVYCPPARLRRAQRHHLPFSSAGSSTIFLGNMQEGRHLAGGRGI